MIYVHFIDRDEETLFSCECAAVPRVGESIEYRINSAKQSLTQQLTVLRVIHQITEDEHSGRVHGDTIYCVIAPPAEQEAQRETK